MRRAAARGDAAGSRVKAHSPSKPAPAMRSPGRCRHCTTRPSRAVSGPKGDCWSCSAVVVTFPSVALPARTKPASGCRRSSATSTTRSPGRPSLGSAAWPRIRNRPPGSASRPCGWRCPKWWVRERLRSDHPPPVGVRRAADAARSVRPQAPALPGSTPGRCARRRGLGPVMNRLAGSR